MAGEPAHRLRRLIAKEVTDNALDACDRAGSPGSVTIERDHDTTTLSDVTTGTRISYTLGDIIPSDNNDLVHAQRGIEIAKVAGPPYARRPSPHWIDADHLSETFATIEPVDTTVRQLIEQLDGCTGATAGKLAAPFRKNRTCRSMTEPEIAALLRAMHDVARIVKPRHLGAIGPDVFGDAFDGHIIAEGALHVGGRTPSAEISVLIEAWASVRSRKGGDATLRVFCNRSPVVGGASATRTHRSRIILAGAGLDGVPFDAEGGDCDLILSVQAPLIPTVSMGKAPSLSRIGEPIADTLRRAFVRSRNRLPPDPAQPKPPKHEPPPKQPRPPPYEPTGPLAMHLAAEAKAEGVKLADLLVLSPGRDPFSETKASRRDAEWFARQRDRFMPTGQVHLRGMYYRILAAGDVRLPDGSRFVGTADTAQLIEDAGKYGRHLGLIPFDCIVDERAAPPEFYNTDGERADPDEVQERKLTVQDGIHASVPEVSSMLPTIHATEVEIPRQPYRICMIGEKTSLGAVLRPIAREVHAELLLETGEISESHAYGIARRAARDGRPLRILYFADFDPAGWQMSVSLARKLQAHIVREFDDLDVRLIRVALTFDQVQEFKLPDSPIKEGDKRAAAWRARWGYDQVEIDALAALRPDLLDRIARAAVAPYFDVTLESRFAEATELPDDVTEWLRELPAYRAAQKAIRSAHRRLGKAVDALNAKAADHAAAVRKAIADAADRPELLPLEIKPDVGPEPEGGTVFDSTDPCIGATRKLQRIKRDYMTSGDNDDY